jgi:hypothetical protein
MSAIGDVDVDQGRARQAVDVVVALGPAVVAVWALVGKR